MKESAVAMWLAILAGGGAAFGAHFLCERYSLYTKSWKRLMRYSIGVVCIGIPWGLWCGFYAQTTQETIVMFVIMVAAVAGATGLGYGIDWIIELRASAADAKELEKLIQGMGDATD